ncbi:NAD(P)-dependent oxidoreductase [Lentibacillus sp. N15]|uniref:NAD(P)-dependent oxidoreductase n=1 Tax=Lentibacillus songyuanensis TaxID=3136161 RepID=UPI0031BA1073
MKIGFIGLGAMGGSLARNIIRSSYDVIVYDISEKAIENTVNIGGKAAASAHEVAEQADVLFTSLPLPQHLKDLLIEKDKILDDMQENSLIIDVSTVDPKTARELSTASEAKNVKFLACPLGKGPSQAEEGEAAFFVGGKEKVFSEYKDFLTSISTSVNHLGDVEQATAFKLISNMIGMTNTLVLAEGVRLADKIGIDPELFQKLLSRTGADSYQLTLRGPMFLNEDYTSKFSVNLTLKDIALGVKMAESIEQITPFSSLAKDYYKKAQDLGYGNEDCAAAYKLF